MELKLRLIEIKGNIFGSLKNNRELGIPLVSPFSPFQIFSATKEAKLQLIGDETERCVGWWVH